nr:DUF4431 domain-containing protein [Acidaminobacter sp. JC074]
MDETSQFYYDIDPSKNGSQLIDKVQLVMHYDDKCEDVKDLVDKKVTVTGDIFEWYTGYHIKPILVNVVSIDAIKD